MRLLGTEYEYNNGPTVVEKFEPGITKINCIYTAHNLIAELYGVSLPAEMDSVHMILDNLYLRHIENYETLQIGDIFFFAPKGITEFRVIPTTIKDNPQEVKNFKKRFPGPHLAVFIGYDEVTQEELLIHGNWVDKQVSIWPLSRFQEYPRYQQLYARKRPANLIFASRCRTL